MVVEVVGADLDHIINHMLLGEGLGVFFLDDVDDLDALDHVVGDDHLVDVLGSRGRISYILNSNLADRVDALQSGGGGLSGGHLAGVLATQHFRYLYIYI